MNGLEPSRDSPPPPAEGEEGGHVGGNVLVQSAEVEEKIIRRRFRFVPDLPLELIYFKLQTLMLHI